MHRTHPTNQDSPLRTCFSFDQLCKHCASVSPYHESKIGPGILQDFEILARDVYKERTLHGVWLEDTVLRIFISIASKSPS